MQVTSKILLEYKSHIKLEYESKVNFSKPNNAKIAIDAKY